MNSNLNPKSLFRMVEAPNPNPKFNPKNSLLMGEASNPNLPNPIQKYQTLTLKFPCQWGKPWESWFADQVPTPFPAPFPTLNFNPKTLLPMGEAWRITIPKITKPEKVANSSNFYKIFIEAIPPKNSNHKLILKIFSLTQQPSKSPTFKFLEFL